MNPKRFIARSCVATLSAFILANPSLISAEETVAQPTTTESTATSPATTTVPETTQANPETTTAPETTQPSTEDPVATTPAESEEALPEGAQAVQAPEAKDTVILHTNDIHGRLEEGKGVIGAAKLAGVVEEERKKDQNTVVLDAGDAFQGLPISNSSKGDDMAKIMNEIGYDAMAVGNHEFDFSLEQAQKYKETLNFPLLSSNTYINGARLFQASTIIDKDKNTKGDELVVIGVTTPETGTKTHPRNVTGVEFRDPITEVNNVIAEIESKAKAEATEYNTYVILAHLGIDETTQANWRGDTLAKALSENALLKNKKVIVIDGHSHTVHSATFGNVTYNQTGCYLNNIGKITISKDGTVTPSLIKADDLTNAVPNEKIAALVKAAKDKFDTENSVVVVENNTVELNAERENVRVRETNSGNAITDALYNYGQTGGFHHKTDLAVTNGGGIRATIPAGKPITKGDIISVLPFGNIISQIEVKGSQIKQMFEVSVGSQHQTKDGQPVLDEKGLPLLAPLGGFLQASGVKVYFDPNAASGNRVLAIKILNHDTGTYDNLDLNKTYYLATNDFVAAGGDNYTMLGGAREEGPSLDTVYADFLASHKDLSAYAKVNTYDRIIPIRLTDDSDNDGMTDGDELKAGRDPFVAEKSDSPEKPAPQEKPQPKAMLDSKETKKEMPKEAINKTAGKLPATGQTPSGNIFSLIGLSLLALLGFAKKKSEE